MTLNVLLLKGEFPTGDISLLIDNPKFQEDSGAALSLSDEEVNAVARAVNGVKEPFISYERLKKVVATTLDDKPKGHRVASFVFNICRLAQRAGSLREFLSSTEQILRRNKSDWLESVDLDLLVARFSDLSPFPAIHQQIKAEALAKETGARLEESRLICDVRPVFDDDRESVVGAIPLTTLKLVLTQGDGLPSQLELRLTESQVDDLADQLNRAKAKLTALSGLLKEKSLAQPNL